MTTGRRLLAVGLALSLALAGCSSSSDDDEAETGSTLAAPTSSTTDDDRPSEDGDDADAETGDDEADRDDPVGFEVEPASWRPCSGSFECATVTVPLDHDEPAGPTIEVALMRRPSDDADGDGVLGSLLVNPGGPGGSGVGMIRGGFELDPDTMDDYHLVGFDPRGIGRSTALSCGPEPTDGPLPDFEPDDDEERAELDDDAVALAERCQRLDGDLLPHLSTDSVADDLDLLRRAVGDEKLSYLGFSYGTLIGLRYAEAYPDRVGRLILDSVVDPSSTLVGLLAQQTEGFERVFAEADEACASSDSCPDGGLAVAYDRVAERLEQSAIDGIGPTELAIATLASLYGEAAWPRYAEALADADAGDVSGIRSFYLSYAGAADRAAYLAVFCTDTPVPIGADGWDRLAGRLQEQSPRFGAAIANEVRPCAHWPVRDTTAPEAVTSETTEGLPPILVLSTLGDAATPVENAVNVAAGLDGATLVTVNDSGHIAYGRSFCVDQIVADYLATGELPEAIQRC